MDHFVAIAVDQTGLIPDPKIASVVAEAMKHPFDFTDVFMYSHGWWSSACDAMNSYSLFSVEFTRALVNLAPVVIPSGPRASFGIGIHWPSMLSENPHELINLFEPLSFYQMEKRSDDVGFNAVFSLLQIIYIVRQSIPQARPLKLTLLGHSFGCRVLASALNRLYTEVTKPGINPDYRSFVLSTRINLIFLQAAFECSDMEANERYANLVNLPQLRILITRSDLDLALKNLFPLAERINILSLKPGTRQALGFAGPSDATRSDFCATNFSPTPGFAPDEAPLLPPASRMLVADITAVQAASNFVAGPLKGHHDNIYLPEIYNLIAKFSFQQ